MIGKLTQPQIEELLKDNVSGHLGCNDGVNTYVYPINYLYDGNYIICHSQRGFKINVMAQNPRVCLQVDELEDHKNWESVMVLGEYQQVDDEQGQYEAVKAFADRRLFLKINEPSLLPCSNKQEADMQWKNASKPIIFRIVIKEKNGRYECE